MSDQNQVFILAKNKKIDNFRDKLMGLNFLTKGLWIILNSEKFTLLSAQYTQVLTYATHATTRISFQLGEGSKHTKNSTLPMRKVVLVHTVCTFQLL